MLPAIDANAFVLQTLPRRDHTEDSAAAAPCFPRIARRSEMADDLANVKKQIEQLKASQEQIIRRDAAIAEQFTRVRNKWGATMQSRRADQRGARRGGRIMRRSRAV